MLEAINIHKTYGQLEVLKGIDFRIEEKKIISIVGRSGAGKSTLLHILGTLDRADKGEIRFKGQRMDQKPERELAQFRNQEIGFIFQFHNLLPEFTALENVLIPARIQSPNFKQAEKRAEDLLAFLGLADRKHHKPGEMSGGEQQRVSVARALINQPSIILADEPSGNLDTENSELLHQFFADIRNEFQTSFIIVTHHPDLAKMADQTIRMQDGLVVQEA